MTRLTVHVRHGDKEKMFHPAQMIKTYYYKDGKEEKVIGNEVVYQQLHQDQLRNKKVYTKMTKAKRKIINTYTYCINSIRKDVINQHVQDILSSLKSKGYKYSWARPDKGGVTVDHWYLSNSNKCN